MQQQWRFPWRWWQWGIFALVVLQLVVVLIGYLPVSIVSFDGREHPGTPSELAAIGAARIAVLFTLGGAIAVATLLLTWRRDCTAREVAKVGRDANFTDRYTRAIAQLGDESMAIRLGGIYALERIAKDSERDRKTIIDVLSAWIRSQPSTVITTPTSMSVRWIEKKAAIVVAVGLTREGERVDLSGADFREERMEGIDLTDADLAGANFSGSNLTRVILRGAELAGVVLTQANLMYAKLSSANLNGANLDDADLTNAFLPDVKLRDANLTRAKLTRVILSDAVLANAILDGANLRGADLAGADLSSADLIDADLAGANLAGSNLHAANLRGVNLAGTNLTGANLEGATLRDSDLRDANLTDEQRASVMLDRSRGEPHTN